MFLYLANPWNYHCSKSWARIYIILEVLEWDFIKEQSLAFKRSNDEYINTKNEPEGIKIISPPRCFYLANPWNYHWAKSWARIYIKLDVLEWDFINEQILV